MISRGRLLRPAAVRAPASSSGVFERFPHLKFVMTEGSARRIPPMLDAARRASSRSIQTRARSASSSTARENALPTLGHASTSTRTAGSAPASPAPLDAAAPPRSSASTGSCGAATTRTTRAPPRSPASTCARCSTGYGEPELRGILAENAAKLYDFDLDALAPSPPSTARRSTRSPSRSTELPADANEALRQLGRAARHRLRRRPGACPGTSEGLSASSPAGPSSSCALGAIRTPAHGSGGRCSIP